MNITGIYTAIYRQFNCHYNYMFTTNDQNRPPLKNVEGVCSFWHEALKASIYTTINKLIINKLLLMACSQIMTPWPLSDLLCSNTLLSLHQLPKKPGRKKALRLVFSAYTTTENNLNLCLNTLYIIMRLNFTKSLICLYIYLTLACYHKIGRLFIA